MTIEPLSADHWSDFAILCADMGPNRSCWCMWWRYDGVPSRTPARERARSLVRESHRPVGLIAYEDQEAIGWVAVGPRDDYPRLNRGRDTAPIDDSAGVWVIPCFFVRERYRGHGVATALLEAAVRFAMAGGAAAIEGVPGDPTTKSRSAAASYTGTVPIFRRAGFVERTPRTPRGRVVMRKHLP